MANMSYLLSASPARMAGWKEAARAEGVSFAEWLRRAADAALCGPPPQGVREEAPNIRVSGPITVTGSSFEVTPHPKGSPVERRSAAPLLRLVGGNLTCPHRFGSVCEDCQKSNPTEGT